MANEAKLYRRIHPPRLLCVLRTLYSACRFTSLVNSSDSTYIMSKRSEQKQQMQTTHRLLIKLFSSKAEQFKKVVEDFNQ
mmetsp:Transcript_7614/g.7167  ORF Transcript_7614/g.7167 Transcript_7614/m.7167 type:complete len:80 (+) Transcript_7614:95-334(+)